MNTDTLLRSKEQALAKELRAWAKEHNLLTNQQELRVTLSIDDPENAVERLLAMNIVELLHQFWPKEFSTGCRVRLCSCFEHRRVWLEDRNLDPGDILSVRDALNMRPRELLKYRNMGIKCYAALVTIFKRQGLKGKLLNLMELEGYERTQLARFLKHD